MCAPLRKAAKIEERMSSNPETWTKAATISMVLAFGIRHSKAYRAQLSTRPIAEKLRMLEELRKRALAIAASRRK